MFKEKENRFKEKEDDYLQQILALNQKNSDLQRDISKCRAELQQRELFLIT